MTDTNATQARDDAIRTVRDHARQDWLWWAERALQRVCLTRAEFTSADVWRALRGMRPEAATHEPRAMGAVMKQAIGKWCEPTERTAASGDKTSHCRRLTVWRSLVRDS